MSREKDKPLNISRLSGRETQYVNEVLKGEFSASKSNIMTKRLEEAFAQAFDSKYAIAFANGTATMHAALAAAGIGPGDEVIVPPLTMASTALCVLHAGALPVFADIDPQAWTIDPESIRACITPRTKAIIPVSIYGLPMDMGAIMAIADEHKLFVLEDDAQCFLGYYQEKILGSIGHASSFSFQGSKHMTCGEGGIITTNDEALALSIRRFNSLGYSALGAGPGESKISKDEIQRPDYERHCSVGWNYRMSELCSAVSLAQLERLEELVEVRKQAAQRYREVIEAYPCLIPQAIPDGYIHSYWAYTCSLKKDAEVDWHAFREKYLSFGGDPFYGAWQLTYLEPIFKNCRFADFQQQHFDRGLCPVAESVQPRLLQFKTNYYNPSEIEPSIEALGKTLAYYF